MFKKEDLEIIDDNILGFGYSLTSLLDHLSIIQWLSYMSHRCTVDREVINLDDRPFIELPSGKKIIITIKIKEFKDV